MKLDRTTLIRVGVGMFFGIILGEVLYQSGNYQLSQSTLTGDVLLSSSSSANASSAYCCNVLTRQCEKAAAQS